MKLLYGEFSVTYSEAVQNISRNQSFVQKLETLADEDNQCMFQLCELYQKYGNNRFYTYFELSSSELRVISQFQDPPEADRVQDPI